MTTGIYCYYDLQNHQIDYVGKSVNIERRHKEHLREHLIFDKRLQSNPKRWRLVIICECEENQLDHLERIHIKSINPKYNFTDGGDGGAFFGEQNGMYNRHHTEEAKRKMSENHWDCAGENHPFYGLTGKSHPNYGRKRPEHSKRMVGKNNPAWKDYPRIIKQGFKRGKQLYALKYHGKVQKKSINKESLIEWFNQNYPNIKLEI